jgi:ABC-type nitrate/sulfonate/bicarbonate transport system substrate-binding protein
MKTMRFAAALLHALVAVPASAEDLVRLNTFPTARSLPFFVGVEKGLFAKHGIKLEFEFTESSSAQRQGLANGKFEVVHSAVDSALAMIEVAKVDVVIVSGGDGGTNEFIVGRGINSFADVRGKAAQKARTRNPYSAAVVMDSGFARHSASKTRVNALFASAPE